MSASSDEHIPEDQGRTLHERLVAGDETATSDIARVYFEELVGWLKKINRDVAEEWCFEAAGDALISLFKSPPSYKPERGKSLESFLRMSAQKDLLNILRRERRHAQNLRLDAVELSSPDGKYLRVEDDPGLSLQIQEESTQAIIDVVAPARDGLTEAESRALDLILHGAKKTAEFAEALGIGHLPESDQRKEVKRVKDKLKKRVERRRDEHVEPS